MRIMIIAKTLTLHRQGGFETHVTEIAKRLALKNKVDIVCRELPRNPSENYRFNIYDVPYPGINLDAVDNLTSIPAFEKKISWLFSKNDYDIVHGHGITSLAYLRRKERKVPFVYTLHGISSKHLVGYSQPLRAVLKILFDTERACVKGADRIICVSKRTIDDAHKYYGIDKSKCVYIPNGIDAKALLPKRSRKPGRRIGFVGYMHEHKGVQFLLRAMKIIKERVPGSSLYMIGSGNTTKFMEMARKLKIEKNVHFLGNVSRTELVRMYKTFDVFALPSQYEGFGIAALEAMASGVPIVVSDTGELKELADGTGFVVDPANINQLAEKIAEIKGLPFEKVWTVCGENAKKLYGLDV